MHGKKKEKKRKLPGSLKKKTSRRETKKSLFLFNEASLPFVFFFSLDRHLAALSAPDLLHEQRLPGLRAQVRVYSAQEGGVHGAPLLFLLLLPALLLLLLLHQEGGHHPAKWGVGGQRGEKNW